MHIRNNNVSLYVDDEVLLPSGNHIFTSLPLKKPTGSIPFVATVLSLRL